MKLDELYQKCDGIASGVRVTPVDHFIFDLSDENSQTSLKGSFKGIEALLMPECGKYLEVTTVAEIPDCLLLLFPDQTDGGVGFKAFNTRTGKYKDLLAGQPEKVVLDNFSDFADMDEIANRLNQFAFNPNDTDSTSEVIGSFDISNDEPVEKSSSTTNINTPNEEEEKMKFKPISEDDEATKWVEIPNTAAHGVRVTEDDAETEDPFAGEMPADDGAAAEAPADDAAAAPADGTEEAPAEEAPADNGSAGAVDDPKAKMRELLAYYTDYMSQLAQDPNTSTEMLQATQDMIDQLVGNMESVDAISELQNEEQEAVAAEETPADDGSTEAAPADAGTEEQPVQEETEQDEINSRLSNEVDELYKGSKEWENIEPATSDNILTPGDLSNTALDSVDISGLAPTEDEELATTTPDMTTPPPTSEELEDVALPTPEEEDSLFGPEEFTVGMDGLPSDTYDGDIDTMMSENPIEKKISWSQDYSLNGVATTDDNTRVVPQALKELQAYYTKVADEVSKVPGKEDIAMKLQKIQILSQTIQNEWNSIVNGLGDACSSSLDREVMNGVEKDAIDSIAPMSAVSNSVAIDQEEEDENDLAIMDDIQKFAESIKGLI